LGVIDEEGGEGPVEGEYAGEAGSLAHNVTVEPHSRRHKGPRKKRNGWHAKANNCISRLLGRKDSVIKEKKPRLPVEASKKP